MSDLKPWDRQPGETAKAYEHFRVYLDLGPSRDLLSTAQKRHKDTTFIRKLSAKHGWVARAEAYDSSLADVGRQALADEIEASARAKARRFTARAEKIEASFDLAVELLHRRLQSVVERSAGADNPTADEAKAVESSLKTIVTLYRDIHPLWKAEALGVNSEASTEPTQAVSATEQAGGIDPTVAAAALQAVRDAAVRRPTE